MLGPLKSVRSEFLPMWPGFISGFAFILSSFSLARSPLSSIPNLFMFVKEFSVISLVEQVNKYNHSQYSSSFIFAKLYVQSL